MKELIFLNIGGAGVKIGDKTWQLLSNQHQLIDQKPTIYNNQSICNELPSGKFSPRSIFIDTTPEVVDEVRKGPLKNIYNPSNFITGKEDASNIYIRGYYTIGKYIVEQCEQKIINMLQACDNLNGVIINCSMSGGTGSGLTNLLLDRLRYNNILIKKPIHINMVIPSPRISDIIVQPYNFVMGLGDLANIDCNKYVVGYDNEQLYKLCQTNGIQQPGYNQVNTLIGKSICTITHPYRLTHSIDSLQEISTNLIPYPKAIVISPNFLSTNDITKVNTTVGGLYNSTSCMNSYRSYGGQAIISSYGILRGEINHYDGLKYLNMAKRQRLFCDWNPCNLKLKSSPHMLKKQHNDSVLQGLMLINSDSCRSMLDIIHKKYDSLYAKRTFIHWYVGEGIDDDTATYSREHSATIEKDYQEMVIETQQDSYEQIHE